MCSLKQKNNGIQVLRSVLFIGILAFHAGIPGSQILWGGVESFFVLSAYFFTKKLSKMDKREINIVPLIKDRISRLYPVYFLLIAGTFGSVVLIKNSYPITDFLYHVFFSQNIEWMINGYNSDMATLTGHTWTLSIEVYLFIIFLIAYKYNESSKQRKIFNYAAIIIAIMYRVVTVLWIGDPMITSLCPISHMDAFALGSLLALWEIKGNSRVTPQCIKYLSFIFGAVIIIVCINLTALSNECSIIEAYRLYKMSSGYLNNPYTCNVYLGFSLITVGLIMATKNISVHKMLIPFVIVGNVSYSAYLIHYPINVLLLRITDNRWLVFGLTAILSIIVAWTVEKLISKGNCKIKK